MIVLEDLGNGEGFETITPTASIGITASLLKSDAGLPARALLIAVAVGPIRIRLDGTDPTGTVGMLLKADSYFTITNTENIKKLLMIDDGSTSATVSVIVFY